MATKYGLMLFLVGCSTASSDVENVSVRDSAGIAIITSLRGEWNERSGWRVSEEPAIRIGTVEGEDAYLLSQVANAIRLSDGRIAIINGSTQEIRFYNSVGEHLSSVGRQGDGPGEYQGARGLFPMDDDSLFVSDALASRFSVLSSDGRFVRSYVAGWGHAAPRGRLSNGRLIALNYADRKQSVAVGYVRVPLYLLVFTPDASRVDTAAVLPGSEEFRVAVDRAIVNYEVPFGRRQLVFARGERIYTASGDAFAIEVRSEDGSIRQIVRAGIPLQAVVSEDVESWRRGQLERATPRWRSAVETLVRDAPVPTNIPAYSALHVDRVGNIWARLYKSEANAERHWHVFDIEGGWLGTVDMPAGLEVTDIGNDYILGIVRDELGVEYIHLYRLEKNTAS